MDSQCIKKMSQFYIFLKIILQFTLFDHMSEVTEEFLLFWDKIEFSQIKLQIKLIHKVDFILELE